MKNQMEQDILLMQPGFKLYKDRAIYIATFIGGPLVAGYLIAMNFELLSEPGKAKKAWIVSICSTLVILAVLFLVPNIDKVPNYLIPVIYTGIARYLVLRFQGAMIKTHEENGGQFYSIWRTFLVGFIGLLVLLLIIFAISILTNKELFL
jgi:hypothetical protein